jgi:hypothetical protein
MDNNEMPDPTTEMVLEQRLMHFLSWCAPKGAQLEYNGRRLGSGRCQKVVDKYVNE